jgi:hypothetical protein
MKMPRPTDYEKYADECVQLAERAQIPEHRIMLMHIAETWQRLADDWAAVSTAGDPGLGKRN